MKALRLVPLLLFALSSSLFAQTEETFETSGNGFLRICSVVDKEVDLELLSIDQKVALMSCLKDVSGFTSGVEIEMLFVKNATKQSKHAPFCVPESVKNIQMVRVVLKYSGRLAGKQTLSSCSLWENCIPVTTRVVRSR